MLLILAKTLLKIFLRSCLMLSFAAFSPSLQIVSASLRFQRVQSSEPPGKATKPCSETSMDNWEKAGTKPRRDAAAIYNLGVEAWKLGDLTNAEKYYCQALLLQKRSAPESSAVAQALNGLGDVAEAHGELVVAEAYYLRAARIGQRLDLHNLTVANSLHGIGNVSLGRGNFAKAQDYFTQALEIRQRTAPGGLDVARSLEYLAMVARFRSDFIASEELCRQALAIQEKLAPESLAMADTLTSLGTLAYQRSSYEQAEQYYRRALAIREKNAPESLHVANSLYRLGLMAYVVGDLAKADGYYHRVLEITTKLTPEGLPVAKALISLYSVAFDRGDLESGEKYLQHALAIQEKLAPSSHDAAISLDKLGGIFCLRGDLAKGEEYERRALAIRKKILPEGAEVATSLIALGDIAWRRGDLVSAENYYNHALLIREKLEPHSINTAISLDRVGDVARERGDLLKAESLYRRALEIQQKLIHDSFEYTVTLNSLGEVSRRLGELIKAEDFENKALAVQQKLSPDSMFEVQTLNHLGNIARDNRDLKRAESYYRKSLETCERLAAGSLDHVDTLASLARNLRDQHHSAEAARLFEKSLSVLDRYTARLGGGGEVRAEFRASHRDNFTDYIDLLIAEKQPELAFQVLERSRARTLLESLAIAGTDIRKGVDPVVLQQERSLESSMMGKRERRIRLLNGKHTDQQLAAIDKEIEGLQKQKEDVEGEIRSTSPVYAALTLPQPLSSKEVQQQLLDADTMLLEYSLGAEHSYVFVLNQDSVAVFELPKNAEIEAVARPMYNILTARSEIRKGETEAQEMVRLRQAEAQYLDAANKLSRMILWPIAPLLSAKRLLVVSDGILQYVPFSALPAPREEVKFVPLIVDHEIVSLPSASVLQVLKHESTDRPKPPREVAVLADPVFSITDERVRLTKTAVAASARATQESAKPISFSQELLLRSAAEVGIGNSASRFPRLFFSKREADAILRQSSLEKTKLAVDFRASRATAISPELTQYRIIHFATHGLLNSEHPELSGLVLSLVNQRGHPQDGFLTLADIYNLTLHADMVVLSACDTGLGKEIKGEGLIGITRGFMYAGASRVVASLWKVDDAATAELMERFYEGILKEGLHPAAALRKAQLEMWRQKRWSFPYYWAGFLMQGQW